MANIPVRVQRRLTEGIKKFNPILKKAEAQDVNESDTVTIITDLLSEVFGYDKYTEVTSELAIKKTFCDLAVKIDSNIKLLIEVKAAGMTLKENHLKQVTDYGANAGIDWVVLTNGIEWKVFKINFGKPISNELVYSFNLLEIKPNKSEDLDLLYMLTKEAISKSSTSTLDEYHSQKQLLNGAMIGQVLMCDDVLNVIRRTLKKVAPEAKITNEEIQSVILEDVLKRELLEDERANDFRKKVAKATKKSTSK